MTIQDEVQELRDAVGSRWTTPTAFDAWAFTVTELSEVGDVLIRSGYAQRDDYVRNSENPEDLHESLRKELGDTLLMLCTVATRVGVNLENACRERIEHLCGKYGGYADES